MQKEVSFQDGEVVGEDEDGNSIYDCQAVMNHKI